LAGRPLISYGSHAEFGAALDEAFSSQGEVRNVSVQIASSVGALPLVRQGLGIALIDGLAVWIPTVGLVSRPFRPTILTPVSLSVDQARPQSRFLVPFAECLKRAFAAAPPHSHRGSTEDSTVVSPKT
jgi:DNA-binding transcriptional LysR family regulator